MLAVLAPGAIAIIVLLLQRWFDAGTEPERDRKELLRLVELLNASPTTLAAHNDLADVVNDRMDQFAQETRLRHTVDRRFPAYRGWPVVTSFIVAATCSLGARHLPLDSEPAIKVILELGAAAFVILGVIMEVGSVRRDSERRDLIRQLQKARTPSESE